MTRDSEAMEDFRQDMLRDSYEDQRRDALMRTDLEFALAHVDLSEDTTVKELREIALKLVGYGWNTSAEKLIGEI